MAVADCYYGAGMTKRETNFVDEDLRIAARALSVLEGHPPGREQPPLDISFERFTMFRGSDDLALPLAQFALVRYEDAIRASEGPSTPSTGRGRFEKRASEQSREALLRSSNARRDWENVVANQEESWARAPHLRNRRNEYQRILAALRAIENETREVLALMDEVIRQLPPPDVIDEFPSTLGLPLAQRNQALGDQALSLFDAGISVEQIGYVMGWDGGAPEHSKDRTRKRLEEARARRTPAPK